MIKGSMILVNEHIVTDYNMEVCKEDKVRKIKKSELELRNELVKKFSVKPPYKLKGGSIMDWIEERKWEKLGLIFQPQDDLFLATKKDWLKRVKEDDFKYKEEYHELNNQIDYLIEGEVVFFLWVEDSKLRFE